MGGDTYTVVSHCPSSRPVLPGTSHLGNVRFGPWDSMGFSQVGVEKGLVEAPPTAYVSLLVPTPFMQLPKAVLPAGDGTLVCPTVPCVERTPHHFDQQTSPKCSSFGHSLLPPGTQVTSSRHPQRWLTCS